MFEDELPFGIDTIKLLEFRIEKLFNKYDVTIKLEDKCFVLIGPNGVGKSTVLRILYNFISGNLVDCVAVPFAKIYIRTSEGEWTYLYTDFFPSTEHALKTISNSISYLTFAMNDMQIRDFLNEEEFPESEVLEKCFDELVRQELWGQFCYLSLRQKKYTSKIVRILNNFNVSLKLFEKIKVVDTTTNFANREVFVGSVLWDSYYKFSNLVPFDGENDDDFPAPFTAFDKSCYYFDMVQSHTLESSDIEKSIYRDHETEWLFSSPSQLYNHPELERAVNCKEYDNSIFWGEDSIFSDTNLNVVKESTRKKLLLEHHLDINKLINATIYSQDIILEVNNTASGFAREFYDEYDKMEIDNPEDYGDDIPFDDIFADEGGNRKELPPLFGELLEINKYFTAELREDYIKYIKPVLVNNSMFSVNMNDYTFEEENSTAYESLLNIYDKYGAFHMGPPIEWTILFRKKLLAFINKVLPILKDENNISPEVRTYEAMLKKYMKDKYISVCPAGVVIKDSIYRKDGNNRIVVYDEEPIDLSVISSGERKIIILFAVAIFFEDLFILLDEPELSLSLVWQEMLLPDLLLHGRQRKIAVATHSPYIVQNEAVRPYIVYLPQQEE